MTPKDQAPPATDEADAPQADLEREGDQPAPGNALTAIDAPSFALERQPIIDLIPQRQVKLLEARAPRLNHAELAAALELAWTYRLDPFANEIWFTKSRGRNGGEGKLLIMVGRDGLRKVAQRNGLELDCDVVRANDTFRVVRGADRSRVVVHEYDGGDDDRGEIVGAWAECYERKGGRQRGFFYAPLGEYRPAQVDGYSPWGKQVSVMVLAAAERQAVRQATPLGGLLVEGEDVLVNEAGEASEADPARPFEGYPFEEEVEAVIDRARRLGHQGRASVATAQMALQGQPEARVRQWVDGANAELDALEGGPGDEDVTDAEVVEPEPGDEAPQATPAGPSQPDEPEGGPEAEQPDEPASEPPSEAAEPAAARPLDSHAATAGAPVEPGEPEPPAKGGKGKGQSDLGL